MPRVWDQFLTDLDRAYDEQNPTFSPKRAAGLSPALVLVDLYRLAFGDRPQPLLQAVKEQSPSNLGLAGWNALPHVKRLLATAREVGIPVIHISRLVAVSEWRELGRADRAASADELARREHDYEIFDELAPVAGELTLRKRSTSAFNTTSLTAVLNEMRIDTLVVAGESTSGCVRATVVDGRNLRFSILIPEECVFDRTEASHAMSLYDMHRKYATVEPLDVVVDYLRAPR